MIAILRQAFFVAVAGALTWWFLLRTEPNGVDALQSLRVSILASSVAAPAEPQSAPPAETLVPLPEPTEAAPPAPEVGRPDGDGDQAAVDDPAAGEVAAEEPSEAQPEPAEASKPEGVGEEAAAASADASAAPPSEAVEPRTDVDVLRGDPELVERARAELAGDARRGFATTLLAAPEDQVAIARAFGEELVLVPREALDDSEQPGDYFRLNLDGAPFVERVPGPFEDSGFLFYRDLFAYDYARLPDALRALRLSVVDRERVRWFAALIPTSEFAVVVGRRDEALAEHGLAIEDVRRFTLRYRALSDGRYDLFVERIELADGRVVTPES